MSQHQTHLVSIFIRLDKPCLYFISAFRPSINLYLDKFKINHRDLDKNAVIFCSTVDTGLTTTTVGTVSITPYITYRTSCNCAVVKDRWTYDLPPKLFSDHSRKHTVTLVKPSTSDNLSHPTPSLMRSS